MFATCPRRWLKMGPVLVASAASAGETLVVLVFVVGAVVVAFLLAVVAIAQEAICFRGVVELSPLAVEAYVQPKSEVVVVLFLLEVAVKIASRENHQPADLYLVILLDLPFPYVALL